MMYNGDFREMSYEEGLEKLNSISHPEFNASFYLDGLIESVVKNEFKDLRNFYFIKGFVYGMFSKGVLTSEEAINILSCIADFVFQYDSVFTKREIQKEYSVNCDDVYLCIEYPNGESVTLYHQADGKSWAPDMPYKEMLDSLYDVSSIIACDLAYEDGVYFHFENSKGEWL